MVLAFALVLGGGYYFYLTDKQTVLDQAEVKSRNCAGTTRSRRRKPPISKNIGLRSRKWKQRSARC